MAATIKIPTTFTAVDKFSTIVRKMTKSIKTFGKTGTAAIKRFDARVTRTWKKLGSLARMGLGIGAGFIALNAVEVVANYEQSLADLSAVMNTTRSNESLLSKDAERLGAITAKSATQVVGLQEAFARLSFPAEDIINMTEATISGSIAMNAELAETAELTGAMIKTFDNFSSIDAPDIIDKMTLSTQKSALNFEKLQTALPIVAGAANAAGISFERTVSLLGKLSDAGIDASSSSTALRNIFLESAKQGLSYDQILKKILKDSNKLTAANDEFGKRGAVSASILSGKLEEVEELTNKLTDATIFQGTAQAAADKRLNTFSGSLTLLKSAYEGLLISTDKSSGALSAMTLIVKFITKHIEILALIVVSLIGIFLVLKVVTGIMLAITAATKIWAAAQWLLNIALNANPISLIIIGVAALIGFIALVIAKYDEWGAALSFLLGPLGFIISVIQSFRRNWDMVKESFAEGGILKGLLAIGKVLFDAVLMPVQQLLTMLAKIPGLGGLAGKGADMIAELRASLGVDTGDETSDGKEVLPSTAQASSFSVSESIKSSQLSIDIRDKGNNVEKVTKKDNNNDIPINISNTVGAF